jgi:hypothetical protein
LWLGRFEKNYAATSSKTYPDDAWQSGQQDDAAQAVEV